jgi:hypothetical protein
MSHKDTLDLKPGTRNGGEFREIETTCLAFASANTCRNWPAR